MEKVPLKDLSDAELERWKAEIAEARERNAHMFAEKGPWRSPPMAAFAVDDRTLEALVDEVRRRRTRPQPLPPGRIHVAVQVEDRTMTADLAVDTRMVAWDSRRIDMALQERVAVFMQHLRYVLDTNGLERRFREVLDLRVVPTEIQRLALVDDLVRAFRHAAQDAGRLWTVETLVELIRLLVARDGERVKQLEDAISRTPVPPL